MKQQKISLKLIEWDEALDNNKSNVKNLNIFYKDFKNNSDCFISQLDFKDIKISLSDISKLQYNSTIAQYNNWLVDLKTVFDGDPAKYSTSCHKIILVSVTLNKQLKIIYNSAIQATSILSQHWQKFEW